MDQTIAIYGLTAYETPETTATEEASQALPYWDDAPELQPQSQSLAQQQQTYTKEEAQELIEMAFQEGWQQGMEEGYKLGKDKGHKEYKEHKVQEEDEEVKKAKNEVKEVSVAYQDHCETQRGGKVHLYSTRN